MTERVDLEAVEKLCEAASPPPWYPSGNPFRPGVCLDLAGREIFVALETEGPDTDFIAQSRTLIPAMTSELREYRAAISNLDAVYACPNSPANAVDQIVHYVKELEAKKAIDPGYVDKLEAELREARELLRRVNEWRGLDGDGIDDPLRAEIAEAL